jgi:hypothetical protein
MSEISNQKKLSVQNAPLRAQTTIRQRRIPKDTFYENESEIQRNNLPNETSEICPISIESEKKFGKI